MPCSWRRASRLHCPGGSEQIGIQNGQSVWEVGLGTCIDNVIEIGQVPCDFIGLQAEDWLRKAVNSSTIHRRVSKTISSFNCGKDCSYDCGHQEDGIWNANRWKVWEMDGNGPCGNIPFVKSYWSLWYHCPRWLLDEQHDVQVQWEKRGWRRSPGESKFKKELLWRSHF